MCSMTTCGNPPMPPCTYMQIQTYLSTMSSKVYCFLNATRMRDTWILKDSCSPRDAIKNKSFSLAMWYFSPGVDNTEFQHILSFLCCALEWWISFVIEYIATSCYPHSMSLIFWGRIEHTMRAQVTFLPRGTLYLETTHEVLFPLTSLKPYDERSNALHMPCAHRI